jgi:FkbM family methyltransferase
MFSQFGEDLAIIEFVDEDPTIESFYVDVGAFHPIHCSNTLLLHKRGWRGMNIDLQDGKIAEFRRKRPNDINIVAACSDKEQEMLALSYDAGGITDRLTTIDQPNTLSVVGEKPLSSVKVRSTTLNRLLSQNNVEHIGYLNIDCEAHDFQVLRGIDLELYKPTIISIEITTDGDDIKQYFEDHGYSERRIYYRTHLYVRRHILPSVTS